MKYLENRILLVYIKSPQNPLLLFILASFPDLYESSRKGFYYCRSSEHRVLATPGTILKQNFHDDFRGSVLKSA